MKMRRSRALLAAAGAALLSAHAAMGQYSFRMGPSINTITQTAGLGPTGSITNSPYMSMLVSGAAISANGTNPVAAQLSNSFIDPAPNGAVYTFPTGGPNSTTAYASVGEIDGNNIGVALGTGTGVTQNNPGGAYPYASELDLGITDDRFLLISGFPANGGYPGLSYQFPLAGILPAGATVNFGINLNFYYSVPGTPAPTAATINNGSYTLVGALGTRQTFSNNTASPSVFSNSNGYSGTVLMNGGNPLGLGFIDIIGDIYMKAKTDAPSSPQPAGAILPAGGSTGNSIYPCTPVSSQSFQLSLSQPGMVGPVQGAGNTFLERGGNGLGTAANWQDVTPSQGTTVSGPPGVNDIALFAAATNLTAPTTFNLNSPTSWAGISQINPGAPVTISAGPINYPLTIGALGITIADDASQLSQDLALTAPVNLAASQAWTVATGQNLTINGSSMGLGTAGLSIQGAGNVAIPTNISGSGSSSITMDSAGTLTLSGTNSYGGGTILNNGEVMISSDGNIGGAASAITFNGGTLGISGSSLYGIDSHNVNWNSFTGGIDVENQQFILFKTIGNNAIDGGSLTKYGPGSLILTTSNTYTGPTTINGGEIRVYLSNGISSASQININTVSGLSLLGGVTLASPISVNLPFGEFMSIAGGDSAQIVAITGNVNAINSYDLGFTNTDGTLYVSGTHTAPNDTFPQIGEGNIIFSGSGSLTTSTIPGSTLFLGDTAMPLNLTLMNNAIINIPAGGATMDGFADAVTIQDQATFNAGTGAFNLDANTIGTVSNTLNLNGGTLIASAISVAGGGGGSSHNDRINFNGGVLTASANSADFLPNPTTGNAVLSVGNGVIINTNTFDVTVNSTQGFTGSASPRDGGLTKEGAGKLIFSSSFSTNNAQGYFGPTQVNGGLLQFDNSNQFTNTPYIQTVAGGAVGVNDGSLTDHRFLQALLSAPSSQTGSLALSTNDASTNIDYTGTVSGAFNMTAPIAGFPGNLSGMSIGAQSGNVIYTGTITPANSTYTLGGGGTLTLGTSSTSQPELMNVGGKPTNVLIENGGVVSVTGTSTYSGTTTINSAVVAANPVTGATFLEKSVLEIAQITDGASGLGKSTSAAANLVINGGILRYIGSGETTSRSFTIGQLGAIINGSGTGPLLMSATAPVAFQAGFTGPVALTLTGTNSGLNTLTPQLVDPSLGSLSLVKAQAGTWVVGGSAAINTFTGGTTVNSGILDLGAVNALGAPAAPLVVNTGGTVNLNGFNLNVGSLSGGGVVTKGTSTTSLTLAVAGSASTTFSGSISSNGGSLALAKGGTGTLALTGVNSFNGGTTLSSGELDISTDANIGGSSGGITFAGGVLGITGTQLANITSHTVNWTGFNGGFDIVNAGEVFTIANNITGNGSLTKLGPGTLVLSGQNTYNGGTTVAAGTLIVPNISDLGTGPIVDNGTIQFSTNGTQTLSNTISGTGGLYSSTQVQNTGGDNVFTPTSVILNASNSFSGNTTIDPGSSMTVNVPGALPGSAYVANNGSLNINANTSLTNITGVGTTTVSLNTGLSVTGIQQDALVNNGTTTLGCGGEIGLISGGGTLNVGTQTMAGDVLLYPGAGTSQVGGLNIVSGSTLDISSNTLAINYGSAANDPASKIRGYLLSAFAAGTWSGTGLTSSTVQTQVASVKGTVHGFYALGYADGDVDGKIGGAGQNQLLVRPVLAADANMDGKVDFNDLLLLAQNNGSINTDWVHADFTYDSKVDFNDLLMLAQDLNATNGSTLLSGELPASFEAQWALALAEIKAAGGTQSVPEPLGGGLAILAVGGILLHRRRPVSVPVARRADRN